LAESRSLARKSGLGLAWSALESFGSAGVSFIVSVVMAAFVAPREFGLIAMLQVFMAVAQVITEAGLTQALVRLPHRTPLIESTASWLNVMIALPSYALLWCMAPWVAHFYAEPVIIPLMRMVSVTVVMASLCVVHTARLTAALDFRRLFRVTGISVVISGIVGIVLAISGYGVWAIAWQQVTLWGIRVLLLRIFIPKVSMRRFSLSEARSLLSFSWKLTFSGVLDAIWTNMYSAVVGRSFTPRAAGLFWRAQSFAHLPAGIATSVVARVAYPLMSRAAGRPDRVGVLFARVLGMAGWVIFPLMALLCAVASPLFSLLFNPQWQPAVPLFRIICLAMMLYPVHSLNLCVLNVAGRSDIFLRLELIKKVMALIILCITVPIGVEAICLGMLANSLIALPLNAWYAGRYSRFPLSAQLKILTPSMLLAILAAAVAYVLVRCLCAPALSLPVAIAAFLLIYMYGSRLLRLPWPRRLAALKI